MPDRMATSTRVSIGGAVAVWLLTFAPAVSAQEIPGYAKNGFYAGVAAVPAFTFDGETFDGSSYYREIGGDEVLILPKLDSQSTMRAIGGFRLTRGSFEVGYERTRHTGTFMGLSGNAKFEALNLDERIYVLTRGRVQPYGLLGLSLPRLTVEDGSAVNDSVGDGSFHGFGLNIEPGVAVFVLPRVGFTAGYRYRVMWFDTAKGVSGKTYELRPRFRETAGSLSLSAFVTF